jgi:hypothetical protein
MHTVLDSYFSQRAPNVRAVRVSAHETRGPDAIVVFRRLAANDWRVATVVPPLDGWPANTSINNTSIGIAE